MADLKLIDVKKSFGDVRVLHGINLDIKHSEFVVLVGSSGFGKSTLLRLIAGLNDISSGSMEIKGEQANDLAPAKRGIAMVFQSYALYPHLSVFKNMSFGLKVTGKDKAYIKQKVEQAAKTLDIDHLLDRLPRELSGSQRKRVAIVRAIVRDPKVFLFDEPLSNLDAAFKVQTRVEIGKMHKKLGATIVYVTHAQVEAMTLGDKIVVMNDGRVEQCGIPLPLYQHPLTKFVAGFIGLSKMNFMEATVRVVETDHLLLALSDGSNTQAFVDVTGCNLDDVVTFNIRPEHLTQSPTHSMRLSATVTLVEQLGESSYLYLKLTDGTELVMRTYGESTTTIGEMIDISYNADDAHVFNSDGSALKRLKAGNTKSPAELVRLKQLVS